MLDLYQIYYNYSSRLSNIYVIKLKEVN